MHEFAIRIDLLDNKLTRVYLFITDVSLQNRMGRDGQENEGNGGGK